MVRSIKSWPRTPISVKRIISNSSISPLHSGKKTKSFTSPNHFTVLSSNDISDDTVLDAAQFSCDVHRCTFTSLHIP
jgi:hypothetical protein